MSVTRRVFLGIGAATAAVAAGQWLHPRLGIAQGRDRAINLYSARHYGTDTAIYDSFTRKTGIKVNLVEADADKLIERIKSEGANSPADVIITVDAGRLARAQDAGILQAVNSRVLNAAVPSNLRDPNGLWFGLAKRARVILYNKDKVRPSELSTYEDLANSKWKGRLIARSSTHVYNQSLTGSILAAHGEKKTEEWARGLVANFARSPEGNDTAQIRAIAAGVADVTFVNTYYLPRLAKSDKPEDKAVAAKIGVFFPNQGTGDRGVHINISGGAVVKTAPNREAAIQFLEHLVSREAQEIFAKSNHEYPVLAGVAIDPTLASYGDLAKLKQDQLNAATFGKNNRVALQIMDRAGWK
jgi:iron(III) transport system substrate-binding protein